MENIIENTLVQMTFVLLILSMVSEKITNFIKLHFPKSPLRNRLNPSFKATKEATIVDYERFEKKRSEREVQVLALVIGVSVALLTRASIFQIYVDDYRLGWIGFELSYVWSIEFLQDFLGCLITGVFLSLGSKFFHDLLGLIYQIKKVKSRLAEGPSDTLPFGDLTGNIAESTDSFFQSELEKEVQSLPGYVRTKYSAVDSRADIYLDQSVAVTDDLKRFISINLPGNQRKAVELNYIRLDDKHLRP